MKKTPPCNVAHKEGAQLKRPNLMVSAEAGAARTTRFAHRFCMFWHVQARLCRSKFDRSCKGMSAGFEQEEALVFDILDV